MKNKRFGRSNKNKILFGVASGLAQYSGRTPFLARAFFIVGTLLSIGAIAVAYIALAIFLPLSDDDDFDINDYRVQ